MRLVGLRAVQHPQGLPSYYRSLQELYGTVGGTGDKILLGSNGEESKVRVEQSRPPLPAKKRQRNKRNLSLNYSPPLLAAILVVVFA
jgi:hypothetical protein